MRKIVVTMWDEGPIPDALSFFPGYLLARLGAASSRRLRLALEPDGLHPRHFGVMNIVAAAPGITQQRLHEQTAIDASSMVAVIDELENMALAERRPHPDDRRARAIYLTERGGHTLTRLRVTALRLQQEFFAALSDDERTQLHHLLRKVAESRVGA